ncbi:MAG: hypothetical protein ACOC7S_00870 [Planctomycetota bacterium]
MEPRTAVAVLYHASGLARMTREDHGKCREAAQTLKELIDTQREEADDSPGGSERSASPE